MMASKKDRGEAGISLGEHGGLAEDRVMDVWM